MVKVSAVVIAYDEEPNMRACLVIVDRQEQEGKRKIEAQGVSLISLLTLDDLKAAQPGT